MDTSVNWKIEWWRLERMNRLRKSWKKYFSTWARKCLVIDEVWNWTSTWQFWSNDSRRLAQCRSVMFLHNCVKNSGKYLKGWEEEEEEEGGGWGKNWLKSYILMLRKIRFSFHRRTNIGNIVAISLPHLRPI